MCLTYGNQFDVGILFSQDQDLAEAAREVKVTARAQERPVELYSAFPYADHMENKNPIGDTYAIRISLQEYEQCLDPSSYSKP